MQQFRWAEDLGLTQKPERAKAPRFFCGLNYNLCGLAALREQKYKNGPKTQENTKIDLSQIHVAQHPGVGGGYFDLDYYPALGRAAGMAFLECDRVLGCQRRGAVSLCLAGL
jgi:hypothetical protein